MGEACREKRRKRPGRCGEALILVSACLAGLACRYDGSGGGVPWVRNLVAKGKALPFCPEQLGGLPTPREAAEQRACPGEDLPRIFSRSGEDLTEAYRRGAAEGLRLARLVKTPAAVLKERSPSCGVRCIYNGRFDGTLLAGEGMTARLFREAGITLFSEEEEALWLAFVKG